MAYQARITPQAQAFHEKMFPDREPVLPLTDPEFAERFENFAFDEVVAEVQLDDRTRYLGWLATLLGCQGIDEFRAILPAALRNGITPIEAKEVVYQAVAYLGMGRVRPFLKATNEILRAEGVELPLPARISLLPEFPIRVSLPEEPLAFMFAMYK